MVPVLTDADVVIHHNSSMEVMVHLPVLHVVPHFMLRYASALEATYRYAVASSYVTVVLAPVAIENFFVDINLEAIYIVVAQNVTEATNPFSLAKVSNKMSEHYAFG